MSPVFRFQKLLKPCVTISSNIAVLLHLLEMSVGPPRRGQGGTMTPGHMDFRGPMGFRKIFGFSSRGAHQNDTEKSACEA